MKPFVEKGSALVETYIADHQTDYQALATQLKRQNEQLIQSCTMTGKTQDELHIWLHPHIKMAKSLAGETDAAKAGELVLRLQDSYREYHRYFD